MMNPRIDLDVAVIGAGFAGIHMLQQMRSRNFDAKAFEAGDGVGGTWFWNRYPGARCDFSSFDYSYEFDDDLQREWKWSERFPRQPEILRYLNHVVDRHHLREHIELQAKVTSANYDEALQLWKLKIETPGGARIARARFVVFATGALSEPRYPDIPGRDRFEGELYHSASWPSDEVEFSGKRIAVVGTGSSGAQIVSSIAPEAAELFVIQRTPSYVVPAHNRPLTDSDRESFVSDVKGFRDRARAGFLGVDFSSAGPSAEAAPTDERERALEDRWDLGGSALLNTYDDVLVSRGSNDVISDFIRSKIGAIVDDEETARRLMPQYPVGARRIVVESAFHESFNRENVHLVDARELPINAVTANGLIVGEEEIELDMIIFATGFDALTGPPLAINPIGRGGSSLREAWAAGPETLYGLMVNGFPNLFHVAGAGSPSVLSNVVRAIEQHVSWISGLIEAMRRTQATIVEPRQEAQESWVRHVNEVADTTLLPTTASWYLGANVPGKPRVFMPYAGGIPAYQKIIDDEAQREYPSFHLGSMSSVGNQPGDSNYEMSTK